MPPQKRHRPWRRRRKKAPARRKTNLTVPRGMRQAIIPCSRDVTYFVNTDVGLPTNWHFGDAGSHYNTVAATQVFTMDMLTQHVEFGAMFRAYKLNCVIVTITSLHNTSQFTSGSAQNYYGGSLIVYAQKNLQGQPLETDIDQGYWDQIPAKKTFLLTGEKPLRFKVMPKQLGEVYVTSETATTVQRKPGWTTTAGAGMTVPHYGLNLQFSYTDPNLIFSTHATPSTVRPPLNFRVNYKYLFQLRGVH